MLADLKAGREAQLAGDPWGAQAIFEKAVAERPADAEARYWLATAKMTAGDADGAAAALDEARILQTLPLVAQMGGDTARCRIDGAYAAQLAAQLYSQNLVAMSGVVQAMALSAGAWDVSGLLSYGLAMQHQGRVEEACQIFRVAADETPSAPVRQFLVYAQLFRDEGERFYSGEARAWAQRFAKPPAPPAHDNPPLAGRRLRVGYVAPNFASSQLRPFITPILENHDPEAVEVVLYPADAATEGAWPAHVAVHQIGQLSDGEAAALIRRDGIDVLNDCWGHTAGSRLGVFALKPAPVQAAWINFFHTTGLPQIDYVLHAAASGAPQFPDLFVERIWPVAPVFTPFRPAAERLPPVAAPALRNGRVTLGSFNHPAKLSDWALDAWASVLRGAPDARLLLKYAFFADPVLQRVTQARFAARGVEPERIEFEGRTTGEAYYRSFQGVDLMLDAWPAPGSTTTLEALSNGVPVLAMVGDEPSVGGLYARTILEAAGLPDLVTAGPEAFVDRALALAQDPEALDRLRQRVRPGFDGGPLCDEAGFTRRLEQAYAEMFDAWRAQFQPAKAAVRG